MKRILFDHIEKAGGTTVTHHLRTLFPQHATFLFDNRDPPKSHREFTLLSQGDRFAYRFIAGHQATKIAKAVHPQTQIVTVARHPIDRVVSWYCFFRQTRGTFWHHLCSRKKLRDCVGLIGCFRNHYTKTYRVSDYDYIALSPEELLRYCGYNGPVERLNAIDDKPVDTEDVAAVEAANQDDLIWYALAKKANAAAKQKHEQQPIPAD